MDYVNSLNSAGFIILGVATLWSVRLIYGARRGPSDDLLKRLFLLAGWILILGGSLGFVGPATGLFFLLYLVCFVLAMAAYFRYMRGERRALLWSLAIAAERGIPLEQAARAFADERSVQIGTRVAKLANLLEDGVPLPSAVRMSGNPLTMDALLAASLGAETGAMGPALQMSLDHAEHLEETFRNILARYLYVVFVVCVAGTVLAFTMLRIVWVWGEMFEELELELPASTCLLIALSDPVVRFWPLLFLLLLLFIVALAFLAPPVRYFPLWSLLEPPFYGRLWIRYDGSLILRSLALCVRLRKEIAPTVFMLSRQYPTRNVSRRLLRASQRIDEGVHWCDALRDVGILRRVDVAVLKAAERAGNLAWALDEMADSALRRCEYRLRTWLNVGFPVVVVILGGMVAFIVISLFMPLVALIRGLA